jgi:hypothetical protein
VPDVGDRMLLGCDGGPSQGRLVHWPPPLEVTDHGGIYVLVDDDPDPHRWTYHWIPSPPP